jgi:hypothetical protein
MACNVRYKYTILYARIHFPFCASHFLLLKKYKSTLIPSMTFMYRGMERINKIISTHVLEPGWRSPYSDWLRTGRQGGRGSSPDRNKNFLFSASSRPVLEPTQPTIQWVPGVKRPGHELTTQLQIKPRYRKRGSIHPLPHTPT